HQLGLRREEPARRTLTRTPANERRRGPRSTSARPSGVVRPAWALSCGCKSRRKETIPIEANRSCGRATNRGKEAGSETAGRCTRTGSEATPGGASEQWVAKLRWSRPRRRKSSGGAVKDSVLTWGDLALCLKG